MAVSEIAIYQLTLLWLVGSIGIVFSYILPVSKNRKKANGPLYARLFLFLIMLCQTVLTARLFESSSPWLYAHPVLALAASYLSLLTVFTRFGEVIEGSIKNVCIAHVMGTSVVFTMMNYHGFSSDAYTALMVVNAGIPILAATIKVKVSSRLFSVADHLLFYVLLSMCLVLLIVIPIFLFSGELNALSAVTFGFCVSIFFMVVFMLAFGSSVMFELVSKLNEQMTIDALTKAKNRRFFEQTMPQYESAVDRKQSTVSLIACDIDHFKQVNDKYGHDVGDIVLCHFVDTLQEEIRGQDALIRMGGEEFLIICPNLSPPQAFQLAERLRKTIALSAAIHDKESIFITASFGVATLAQNERLHKVVKHADAALYRAKSLGRNRVVAATPESTDMYEL